VHLQITAAPDARLLATAVRRGLRPWLFVTRGLGWAVIGLALLLVMGGAGLSVTLLLTGVLLAVGAPMFLTNAGVREALRENELTTYEITDGGVASAGFKTRHAYAWNAFSYVEEMPGQLIFGRSGTRVLPVPTAGLTPAEIEQVLGTAAGQGIRVRRA
jgi:hypothetical protein